jgi:predicted DNA-binding transcriptional regulator AlpA
MPQQWSVRVTAPVPADIDIDALATVAEKLRATFSHDGARHLLTADFRVIAPTLRKATDGALRAARALPAKPTRLQVLSLDDWIAEQKAPRPQDLVGSAEAALLLGVSRQRVGQLVNRPDFPSPIARLSAGPVWTRISIEAFGQNWTRKITGRPRKAAPA